MTKDLISIEKDEWGTEVNFRVPSFQNFGARMGDVQLGFFQALTGRAAEDPERMDEVGATDLPMPDYRGMLADMAGKALETAKGIMSREEYDRIEGRLAEITNKDWRLDDEVGEADSETFSVDLQALRVVFPAGSGWDPATEATLDGFLRDWPLLRQQVLQAVCDFYEELHREDRLLPDPFLAPRPGAFQIVEDRICITTIYLRDDGLIGLSGDCTWDDEHGLGVLLEDGRVIEAGHAALAFEKR